MNLFHRVRRQRYTQGIADPFSQERADADSGSDVAGARRAGLGDAEVQRIQELLRREAIGADHQGHPRRLQRNNDVLEPLVLEQPHVAPRALHHRLGRRVAILSQQVAFQRARVHADANRQPPLTGRIDHGPHPLRLADIARIQSQLRHSRLRRRDRQPVVEVDIGDHGYGRIPHQLG